MMSLSYRLVAAAAMVCSTALSMGLGVAMSHAADKTPDLTELREAVSAAAKRGENVDEVRKAVDALQKVLEKGWTAPERGKTVEPPPELSALHEAVEAAARKGENVEEIRTQLEAVERAMLGKPLARPKPQPLPPLRPMPVNPQFPPDIPRLPAEIPALPFGGIDNEMMKKAQDLTAKASEKLLKDPNDPEARRMLQEAQELTLRAMTGAPGLFVPGAIAPIPGMGRGEDRFRLGVRLERVSELAADQLNLDVARGIGISDVVEGSPAAKAGLKRYDIVLEFAGKPVSDRPEDFMQIVSQVKGGEKVNAVVLRKGKKVEIKGIEMPDAPQVFPPRVRRLEVPFPPPEGRPQAEFGDGRLQPRGGNSVAVSNVNGQLTIKAVQNGVTYEIQGRQAGENIEVSKVQIADGEKKVEAATVDKVPDDYRPMVERLLKSAKAPRTQTVPVRPQKDN